MVGPGVAVAVETRAEQVLVLLEDLGPSGGPSFGLGRRLGRLLRAFPSRTVALLLRPEHRRALIHGGLPKAVLTAARDLPHEDLLALARAVRENHEHVAQLLSRIPPSQREALFRSTYADVDTWRTFWSSDVLEALPHAARAGEATRMLTLREVADDQVSTLLVTSFLPIAEARPRLEQATTAAKAEERGIAYRLLVDCTRRSRSSVELGITLQTLQRLRNEQEPVRLLASSALVKIPPGQFDDGHLEDLSQLITAIVDARDHPFSTIAYLRHLMVRFLAVRPASSSAFAAALAGLDRLAEPSGTIEFGYLLHRLPRGAERPLLAGLLPRMRREADRERFDLTLSLATALGRRAWELEDLQDLLGRATQAHLDSTVRRAVELWLAPPRTRADRVGHLVGRDPSALTLTPVLRAVTTHRQDLLDVLLRPAVATRGRFRTGSGRGGPFLKGRFLSGEVRYVPVITSTFGRWLPRQHRAYADALHQLIADPATKTWTAAAALGALARLPQIGAVELALHEGSSDVTSVEAVLAGLAWTDNPADHLTRLLGFADSDRARVAVYAASRCARFAPSDVLSRALDTVLASPTAKVTARKEAVRLLALHHAPGALDRLLVLAEAPHTHRDVRIAIGRSLRAYLDAEGSWPVLTDLAAAGPDEARSLLETAPPDMATRHRGRFADLVARVAIHPDRHARTEALARLAAWSPWSPDAADVVAGHVVDLSSGSSWRHAAASLVAIYADEGDTGQTNTALARLSATATEPDQDAGADRDRPARQRLGTLVSLLVALPLDQRTRLRPSLVGAADRLQPDPTTLGWQIDLRLCAVDLARPADALREIADLLEPRPLATTAAASSLREVLRRDETTWQPDDLIPPFDALANRGDLAGAHLALALAAVAGPRSGWGTAWRDRLRTMRGRGVHDIAAAALSITTVAE